ncbi:type V CRISPR-associated protein C2c8 [Oscillatoria sp. FACHB-1406]|uniref:type V CRISPR-associated protein C2c8 n=1 Tax=Oscillatoria sp. FACHB-1406 TaxID=2692846 RepID=UPI00168933E3|nr:type V CRISPR-associated protein C2c8 [Oscillatoria sp. FACHB-1406]MBD2579026.1 transposase [Oscillatoria sp. FACHB-1406]
MEKEESSKGMLVLEFKCYPTREQAEFIDRCLEVQRNVWNLGLRALCDFDEFRGYAPKTVKLLVGYPPEDLLDKKGKAQTKAGEFKKHVEDVGDLNLPCCPLPIEKRYVYIDNETKCWVNNYRDLKSDQQDQCDRILVPYCSLLDHQALQEIKKLKRYKNVTPKKDGTLPLILDHEKCVYTNAAFLNVWGWQWQKDEQGKPIVLYRKHPDWREPNRRDGEVWGDDELYPEVKRVDVYLRSTGFGQKGGITKMNDNKILKEMRSSEVHPEWIDAVIPIPTKFRAGTLKNLATSWQEYDKSRFGSNNNKRGKPRFKPRKETIETLIHPNPKTSVKPDTDKYDRLRGIPGFAKLTVDTLKVKGLTKRWRNPETGEIPLIAVFKICKRVSGYYVQLTGELPSRIKPTKSKKAVGIDPGLNALLTTDSNKKIQNPRFLRNSEKRLKRLQRKQAKKLIKRLIIWLKEPGRTVEEIREVSPHISIKDAESLLREPLHSEKDIKAIISQSACNTLKYRHYEHWQGKKQSQREAKLQQAEKRLHEQVKLSRRCLNHKISTYLVRTFGAIAIEDGVQSANLRKKAKKKLREDGSGYDRNRKQQKSGLSKSLVDAAPGQLISLIEQKSKVAGVEFKRIESKNSTKECPVCGNIVDITLEERWYRCDRCNYEEDRDCKAAIVLLQRAKFDDKYIYSENYEDAGGRRCKWNEQNKQPSKVRRKRVTGDDA